MVRVGPPPPGATRELGVLAMILSRLLYTPSMHNCQPCAARIIHKVAWKECSRRFAL